MYCNATIAYGFPVGGKHCALDDKDHIGLYDIQTWSDKLQYDHSDPVCFLTGGNRDDESDRTYYVYVKDSVVQTDDGHAEFSAFGITPDGKWYQDLKSFCEKLNIVWQVPKLMLIISN